MNPDLQLVAEYLAGELDEATRLQVEQRLREDEAFRRLTRQRQAELVILRAKERADLKNLLRATRDVHPVSPRRNPGFSPLWFGLAAAAVLVVIFLIINPFNPKPDPQALALQYLEPFPVNNIRGESPAADSLMEVVLPAYQAGQYAAVAETFDQVADLPSFPDNQQLMAASAYLNLDRTSDAIVLLEGIPAGSAYHDIASWNLALAYILSQQQEKAIPLIQEMASSSHYRSAEAAELLGAIQEK